MKRPKLYVDYAAGRYEAWTYNHHKRVAVMNVYGFRAIDLYANRHNMQLVLTDAAHRQLRRDLKVR
jgi:hypothetical protein